MARQFLYLHWKAVRLGMLPLMVAAFGLPLLMIQGLARPEGFTDGYYAGFVLERVQMWAAVFPVLAVATGLTLALSAWSWDHQVKHVHALSLPVPRWRYVLLKFGAGVLLMLLPTAALLVGGVMASAALELPDFVHAYPGAVTVRFFLTTLLMFALWFAFAAGSIRTAVIVLTLWITTMVAGDLVLGWIGDISGRPNLGTFNFADWLMELMTGPAGPFRILTGNWALIDV
jgi:hypothetical protein